MALISRRDESLLVVLRRRALRKQRGLCYWCHEPTSEEFPQTHPKRLTADHLIPLHEGGKTVPGNIVAACRKCNNGRHSYTNRSKAGGRVVLSSGDDTPRSPFEVLKK